MKISIVVSVPEKKEGLGEFYQKLKMFKALGYDGVELAIRDPREIEEKKIRILIDGLGLEVPSITTGQAFSKDGLSFTSPKKEIRKRAIARIKDQISFAAFLKAKVLIGWIRGNWQECGSIEKARKWFSEAIKVCNNFAQKMGIELVLEPINRYEIDSIHTAAEALEFKIGICVDTFHMNIEEVSIAESILRSAEAGLLSHVHLADSNREAPGKGHLNFEEIISVLKKVGYKGFVSVEIFPKGDPDIAAKDAIKEIRRRDDEN